MRAPVTGFLQGPSAATLGLILANIVPYILLNARFGFALTVPTADDMVKFGGSFGPLTAQGQIWRLYSSMFLHYGPIHLILNMCALWFVGRFVDSQLGRRNLISVYLASGLFGALAGVLWSPDIVSVGASGAIFGLYGSVVAVVLHRREVPLKAIPMWAFFGTLYFIVNSVVFSLATDQTGTVGGLPVDNAAHIGGFVSGFYIAMVLLRLKLGDAFNQAAVLTTAIAAILVCQFSVFPRMERLGPGALADFAAREELRRINSVFYKYEAAEKNFMQHIEAFQTGAKTAAQFKTWVMEEGLPQIRQVESEMRTLVLKDQDLRELQDLALDIYDVIEERMKTIIEPPKKQSREPATSKSDKLKKKAARAEAIARRLQSRYGK